MTNDRLKERIYLKIVTVVTWSFHGVLNLFLGKQVLEPSIALAMVFLGSVLAASS